LSQVLEPHDKGKGLKKLGCDYVQGFYYSKPLEGKALLEYLENQHHQKAVKSKAKA